MPSAKKNGLFLSVSVTPQNIPGRQITASPILRNYGTESIQTDFETAFRYSVMDAADKPVPTTDYGEWWLNRIAFWQISGPVEIKPGKSLSASVNLARMFDLTLDSEYTAFAEFSGSKNRQQSDKHRIERIEIKTAGVKFNTHLKEPEPTPTELGAQLKRPLKEHELQWAARAGGSADKSNVVASVSVRKFNHSDEPVIASISLTNQTSETVRLAGLPKQYFMPIVKYPGGKQAGYTRYAKEVFLKRQGPVESLPVAPGEHVAYWLNLSRVFDLTRQPQYVLSVGFRVLAKQPFDLKIEEVHFWVGDDSHWHLPKEEPGN